MSHLKRDARAPIAAAAAVLDALRGDLTRNLARSPRVRDRSAQKQLRQDAIRRRRLARHMRLELAIASPAAALAATGYLARLDGGSSTLAEFDRATDEIPRTTS